MIRRREPTWCLALAGWLAASGGAACSFDPSGLGESGGNTLDTASSGEGSSGGGADGSSSGESEGGESSSSESTGAIGESESGAPGGAMLQLAEAPAFDFGPVPVGQPLSHAFTLANLGEGPAEALGAQLAPPFAFAGGVWPGTTGTCGAVLEGGTACTLDVAFTPLDLGETVGMLAIDYLDGGLPGAVAAALRGGGAGTSANLVVNPGGELLGDPPTGWFDVLGGGWITTAAYVHGGTVSIFAGSGPDFSDLELAQPLALAQWTAAIDLGTLRFRLSAFARTNTLTDDAYRVIVEFRDGNDQVLDSFDTDYQAFATGWTEVTDDRLAPPGTRSLRLVLRCTKVGGSNCNAYYDDISVVAVYP
jgi:hypothetical protein